MVTELLQLACLWMSPGLPGEPWHFTGVYSETGAYAEVALGSYRSKIQASLTGGDRGSSKPWPNLAPGVFFLSCKIFI